MNNPNDVIKAAMRYNDVSQADLAKLFNVSNQAIYNKFRRESWSIDEVVKILESMNCRLIIESGDITRFTF